MSTPLLDWLGPPPKGWQLQRLDRVMRVAKRQVRMADLDGTDVFHYSIPNVQEIGTGRVEPAADIQSDKLLIQNRSLLVSRLNPRKGTVLIAEPYDLPTVCSTEFVPLIPTGIDLRFAFYVFKSKVVQDHLSSAVRSATRSHQRVEPEDITKLPLLVPPVADQHLIADFLDRETAKIDKLIKAQRRGERLLIERREALVLSIFDGKADGDLVRLRFVCDILPGYAFSSEMFLRTEGGARLLRGINVSPGSLRWDDTFWLASHATAGFERYSLHAGDIVVGMDRPWVSEGLRVAEVSSQDLPALLVQRVARIRAGSELDQSYLALCLHSRSFLAHFEPDMTGISVPHISDGQIGDFRIPLLPVSEQRRIANKIKQDVQQIDNVLLKLRTAIHALQERRTALITAAVTGQIDVSSATLPQAAE